MAAAVMMCAVSDTTVTLHDITVSGNARRNFQLRTSQSAVLVGRDYLQQHFSGSLMQTLEGIPGVKAMTIGSGQSKPVIRGLGFNRMVVGTGSAALWQRCYRRRAESLCQSGADGAAEGFCAPFRPLE